MARSLVSRFAVRQPGIVVVGVMLVLLTAGCGSAGRSGSGSSVGPTSTASVSSTSTSSVGSTSSAPGVAGVDACSLVTQSEASAALKVALSRAATSTPAQCDYTDQDNRNAVEVTVRTTTPTEFTARCATADLKFPGIGDAACGGPKYFLVRKGTTEVDFKATAILGAGQVMMNFSVLATTVVTRL